jgi:hypothetical protein
LFFGKGLVTQMKDYLSSVKWSVLFVVAGGGFIGEFVRKFFEVLQPVADKPLTGAVLAGAASVAIVAAAKLAGPLALGVIIKAHKEPQAEWAP